MKHKWEPYSERFEWRDIHETLSFIRPAICCIVYRRIQVFLSTLGSSWAQKTWQYLYLIKWFEPKSNIPSLKTIIWVIGNLRRTVVLRLTFLGQPVQKAWMDGCLPHRLSKRQSQTTVLLRTPMTQMIFFNQNICIGIGNKELPREAPSGTSFPNLSSSPRDEWLATFN